MSRENKILLLLLLFKYKRSKGWIPVGIRS
jgi:hypothetical protein